MSRRRLLVCLALGALAVVARTAPLRASQPQFWNIEGARDFLEGDTDGLSLLPRPRPPGHLPSPWPTPRLRTCGR